ncbi:MAG: hypothetical protein ACT4QD_09110, partial [Acidobacteriota bacterium]
MTQLSRRRFNTSVVRLAAGSALAASFTARGPSLAAHAAQAPRESADALAALTLAGAAARLRARTVSAT